MCNREVRVPWERYQSLLSSSFGRIKESDVVPSHVELQRGVASVIMDRTSNVQGVNWSWVKAWSLERVGDANRVLGDQTWDRYRVPISPSYL